MICLSFLVAGIGFTLLTYSRDGDDKNSFKFISGVAQLSNEERWEKLQRLTSESTREVTWNTSLFVAIVSTLFSFASFSLMQSPSDPMLTLCFLQSLGVTFLLQDTMQRWKNAHRRNPNAAESAAIISVMKNARDYK